MSDTNNFLILGCGNMAQALVEGMAKTDPAINFITYTPSGTRAKQLADNVNGKVLGSLAEIPSTDYLMLACKPQQFSELARTLKEKISRDVTIISILAGVSTQRISKELNHSQIIRIMPNTPALVGAGVNAFYFTPEVSYSKKAWLCKLYQKFSEVFILENENEIDLITPYSGCGPAYFFELTRILTDHLISKGIDQDMAIRLVKATAYGAGKLLNESSQSAQELRDKVTSKGGVTFAALESFRHNNLEAIVSNALEAAHNRNSELSKQ